MSITDELREYVQDWRDTPGLMDDLDGGDVDGILEDFIRIAGRIDEEADRLCDVASEYAYDIGFDDGWQAAMDELDNQSN